MKLQGIGKSDPGLKHKLNEDRFLLAPELGLYVIADGMGGHKGGDVASRMVIETMADYWKTMKQGRPPSLLSPIPGDLSEQGKHLVNSIMTCNLMIHDFRKAHPIAEWDQRFQRFFRTGIFSGLPTWETARFFSLTGDG
jgi:hypothetical protein